MDFACSNFSRDNISASIWSMSDVNIPLGYAMSSLLIIFILIGVPWNISIVAIIFKKHLYEQPTYMMLLSLTLINLLYSVLCIPFIIIAQFIREFPLGNSDYVRCQVCHFCGIIQNTFFFVSVYSLVLLSLDRLVYTKRPLRYESVVTMRRVIIIILIVWFFSFFLSSLPLFGIGLIDFGDLLGACSIGYELAGGEGLDYIYFLFIVAGLCFIPVCILVVSNIWLLCIIRRNISKGYHRAVLNTSSHVSSPSLLLRINDRNREKHLRLTQIFGVIFLVNIITWTPSFFSIILLTQVIIPIYIVFAHLCLISQVVIHPIVQVVLLRDIRSEITRCWKFWKCRRCGDCERRVWCCKCALCLCFCDCMNAISAAVVSHHGGQNTETQNIEAQNIEAQSTDIC